MHKFFLVASILFFTACVNQTKKNNGALQNKEIYSDNFEVYDLPEELKEISGFTFITDDLVAAVEDEHGLIYYLDIKKNKIVKTYKFAENGDYEDIVKVKDSLFVIESNGNIYQISDFERNPSVSNYKTPLKSKNDIEGITFDENSNSLLLSIKEKNLNKDDKEKDLKNIYSFSLTTKVFNTSPVYQINLKKIQNHFKGDKLTEVSKRFLRAVGNENQNETIKPTAITFKTGTKDLYVLSSINNIIVVMSSADSVKDIITFHGQEFSQPEGIAFNSKGELFISNEGKKNPGNIIKIKKIDAK